MAKEWKEPADETEAPVTEEEAIVGILEGTKLQSGNEREEPWWNPG